MSTPTHVWASLGGRPVEALRIQWVNDDERRAHRCELAQLGSHDGALIIFDVNIIEEVIERDVGDGAFKPKIDLLLEQLDERCVLLRWVL